MAADMISSPRFVSVENNLTPHRSASKQHGPFRATQLWNDMILHLKQHVEVKRRRVKMKAYDACFTGVDAVDVVLQHLMQERTNFANKDISRDKAVKLCQLMLDNCIFESVKAHFPLETQVMFEDSTTKCYRFLDEDCAKENKYIVENMDDFNDGPPPPRCASLSLHQDLEPDMSVSDSSIIGNPMALEKRGQIVQEIMDITGTWKRYSSECLKVGLKRKLTPGRLFNKRVSLPDCKAVPDFSRHQMPPAVEEEVWHEVALSQLLMLVEIPVLDTILSYEAMKKGANNGSAANKQTEGCSNLAFKRWESVTSLFSEKVEEDPWVEAAMDTLECHPKGLDMLDLSLNEETDLTQKLRMYQSIADHYTKLPEPLWSEKFVDLHLPLLNLLMQGKEDTALRVLQLSMLLLPAQLREEMRRLLVFMKFASEDEGSETAAIQLSSSQDNHTLISRTFSSAIIRNKIMTPHQTAQLVMFMADYADKLLDTPTDVEDLVLAKLRHLGKGVQKAATVEPTYCKRVSEDEFRKQQLAATEVALVQLMNTILDDTKMHLKEKKQRLKQLQKHHPQLYMRHFGDMQ